MACYLKTLGVFMILVLLGSCSVISRPIKKEAGAKVDFNQLIKYTDGYLGQTIILGGYVIEVENNEETTLVTVLQAPLDVSDSPLSRDKSQGRFIVSVDGFLDPAVYEKDRSITVAGIVEPPILRNIGTKQVKYIKVKGREIFLHSEKTPVYDDRYYWNHPYDNRLFYHRWHRRL
ncbi:MAG: Slp family lipoprotein [Desulfobacterium sp.]|nr:Slp family lipoprotein [Desulfobacterium sp.]